MLKLPLALSLLVFAGVTSACVEERDRPPGNNNGSPDANQVDTDGGTTTHDDASQVANDGSITDPDGAATFPDAAARTGLGVLGWSSHSIESVDLLEIGNQDDRLNLPRDLAFNPEHPGELWVVNRRDDSTVTYFNVGTPEQTSEKRIDSYALHFMEEVSSIAFGAPGTFGTCQESRNTYNGQGDPNDFMGPALWPSDMAIYGMPNPQAVADIGFDLGSHIDMLHESPLCMGIAWDHDNVYWTFDGMSSSISRYDFQQDHGPGYDDHSDGIIARYVAGEVRRVADIPSHMKLDHATGLLYIADTGNARIVTLDTRSGTPGRQLSVIEPGTTLTEVTGATLALFSDEELDHPSGLALWGDMVFVADAGNGRITAYDLEGNRLDWIETGLSRFSLMGLTVDDEGRIYFVDATMNRVLRIAAKPE